MLAEVQRREAYSQFAIKSPSLVTPNIPGDVVPSSQGPGALLGSVTFYDSWN